MRIYMVNDHIRNSDLLGIKKMRDTSTTENIYELFLNDLKEIRMDHLMLAKKLVCVEVDGASITQGKRSGLCIRLELSTSPNVLNTHCVDHRMNLNFK